MTVPTAPETALLRSRPHNTKLYLSIFQPVEVFSGMVTGTVAKGDRVLSLYNTSGTAAPFDPNMTMLVGTTLGGDDKGRIRVKSLSTGTVTVAENSHINWQVGDYVKIIRFFEVWPVYPRIIQDPGDETNTLWYKDYDVEYTDQNSKLGYFICMGPHHAGFLENGQFQVYYSAEGTEHVRSDETGTSYYWTFGGPGSPSSSNLKTPGLVTYSTPGYFTTRLIVSGSVTQSSDFSTRHISVLNPPGTGTSHHSISEWQFTSPPAGSRDQGGYTASIRIFEDISGLQIRDGSLVVVFANDRYKDTDQSIGGNATNRSTIFFVGYIIDGTIRYNYRDSYIDFDLASPTEFMKMAEGFSVSVQDSDDPAGDAASNPDIPSGWVALLDMDIKKALYHYLRWHSTVLNLCDFQYVGTNQPIQYFDADRTSIYDAINTLISSAVMGGIVCDRQGKVWAETDIYVTTGTYSVGLSLTKQDWMNEPVIEDRPIGQVSYIEIGGIAYNGATFEALMSAAPGATPAYRGRIQRIQGLALTDQAQLNILSGNLYAQLNARYPSIDIQLAGNYRNFDIAPQEIIPLTVSQNDTIRGITFNQKHFFINNMRWNYNPKTESLLPVMGLEELTSGFPGDSLEIPDIPPIEGDAGGFVIPPIVIPPIVLPPWPTIPLTSNVPSFIPVLSGYNKTTTTVINISDTESQSGMNCIEMNTTDDIKGSGVIGLPAGTFTFTPVFHSLGGAAAAISIRTIIQAISLVNPSGSGSVPLTVVNYPIAGTIGGLLGGSVIVPMVRAGVVRLYTYRFGQSDASDMFATSVFLFGWFIS